MIFIKRVSNIYEKIYSIENLKEAHKQARKGKSWYKEVKAIDENPDDYLIPLSESLKNKTYKTSEYIHFIKNDKGKDRKISKLPYYPDRICQWAIMLQLEKTIVNTFIYDSYASIPKKGTHLAVKRMTKVMRNRVATQYCLKLDVKKYFENIDHNILKQLLSKKIKDKDLLWLLSEIIDSIKIGIGIPIGNYLSQYLANFYLTYFDHTMKEVYKCKYYYRYMDDIIILHDCKIYLHKLRLIIQNYLIRNLNITLKNNWQVFPSFVRGVDFLGYRNFGNYKLLRKCIIKNIKNKVKLFYSRPTEPTDINSIMSYMGWLLHCNSYNFREKYMNSIIVHIKGAVI